MKLPTLFSARVLEIVSRIPRGTVRTYQQVAHAAGNPRAQRAVGTIMSKNFNPAVPCHRVIRSDGSPGQYNKGIDKKIALLKSEGIVFPYTESAIK